MFSHYLWVTLWTDFDNRIMVERVKHRYWGIRGWVIRSWCPSRARGHPHIIWYERIFWIFNSFQGKWSVFLLVGRTAEFLEPRLGPCFLPPFCMRGKRLTASESSFYEIYRPPIWGKCSKILGERNQIWQDKRMSEHGEIYARICNRRYIKVFTHTQSKVKYELEWGQLRIDWVRIQKGRFIFTVKYNCGQRLGNLKVSK